MSKGSRARSRPRQHVEQKPCPLKPDKTGHADDEPTPPDDLPEDLTPQQAQAVEALLQQPTLARAATVTHISERTLRRWLAEPAFKRAVQEARRSAFSQAIGLTQWYASVAVAALVKVINDGAAPANARVTASAILLKFGREGIELDDLAQRIEVLEQSLAPPASVPLPAPATDGHPEEGDP